MYHFVYGIFYLISLLPLRVLYGLGRILFFLMHTVAGYRKKVVMQNLEIAFPEKSLQERKKIARRFYINLCDTLVETIKLISISEKRFEKMYSFDFTEVNRFASEERRIQFFSSHQMNWELANLAFSKNVTGRWVGIYLEQNNPVFDRLLLKIRTRFGGTMLSAQQFRQQFRTLKQSSIMLAMLSDQSPAGSRNKYWLNFFGKPTPFFSAPFKTAVRNGAVVFFINVIKVKRGHYRYEQHLVTTDASGMRPEEMARKYRDYLESIIQQQPDNYLWSHRRWKRKYDPEYGWTDSTPQPV